MNVNRSTPPRILILLMNYSPGDNSAPTSRAIALHKEIHTHFPDTYLMMKHGDTPSREKDCYLLQPLIPSKGKYRAIRTLKGIISRIWMTIEIMKFVRRKKITTVILRGFDTALLFPFLKLQRVKTFYDFHGKLAFETIQQKRYILAAFEHLCDTINLYLADRILVVSDGIQSQIPEYQYKCLLIENGVDIEMIEEAKNIMPLIDIPGDKYVVGFIGNWEEFMNIEDICKAVLLKNNIAALIIGAGYRFEEIKKRYSVTKNIIFTGNIDQKDAYGLLHVVDVGIIPYDKNDSHSKCKNFFSSRKTKEYLALGKPIIVSDIIGREQFIIENTNCLLYESRNPKDLAEKISILKNKPSMAQEMSKNNRELAKKFTWNNIIKKSGILEELTEQSY